MSPFRRQKESAIWRWGTSAMHCWAEALGPATKQGDATTNARQPSGQLHVKLGSGWVTTSTLQVAHRRDM